MNAAFSESDARELKRHLIPVVKRLQSAPLDKHQLVALMLDLRPALQLAHKRLEQTAKAGCRTY